MLLNITYDKLKACKIYDFQSLLKENNKWRLLANTIDYDIKKFLIIHPFIYHWE